MVVVVVLIVVEVVVGVVGCEREKDKTLPKIMRKNYLLAYTLFY